MANIPILRFDPPVPAKTLDEAGPAMPPQPGTLSVTTAGAVGLPVGIAIVLALLGAIQPFVSSFVSERLQVRREEARVRSERAEAEAVWLRSALAVEDAKQRETALKFLVKARLVDDPHNTLANLSAAEIPLIPPTAPVARQNIKDEQPPAPGGGSAPEAPGGKAARSPRKPID